MCCVGVRAEKMYYVYVEFSQHTHKTCVCVWGGEVWYGLSNPVDLSLHENLDIWFLSPQGTVPKIVFIPPAL